MTISEMHADERTKWDALAAAKLATLTPTSPDLTFDRYARESAVMPGIAEFLGDLRGQRVLEYGCGLGAITVLLARAGAEVTAFDLSPSSVEVARRRAEIDGVSDRVTFTVASGEEPPFADGSFDVAFGKAILHHLHVRAAAPQLARVVRRGGRAAFVEPMGMNPLLNLTRDHVPYPHKNPPGGDEPVNYSQIAAWERGFSWAEHREIQLFSMLERGLGFRRPLPVLRRVDRSVLARSERARRWCRYVVMTMVK